MLRVDTTLLAFIAGTLIPLATGVITKAHTSSAVKAVVSAILAAVTAVVALLTQFAGVVSWKQAVYVGLGALIAQAASWHGLWKPTGFGPSVNSNTPGVIG